VNSCSLDLLWIHQGNRFGREIKKRQPWRPTTALPQTRKRHRAKKTCPNCLSMANQIRLLVARLDRLERQLAEFRRRCKCGISLE